MVTVSYSVVIPVSKDWHILKLLDSLTKVPEIVLVWNNNPDQELRARTNRPNVVSVDETSTGCNLSRCFNAGIERASYQWIILLNSDLEIRREGWAQFTASLTEAAVVKAYVAYRCAGIGTWFVARGRTFYNSYWKRGLTLFNPGLAFNCEMVQARCGLFDPSVPWGEDGDFSRRLLRSGLAIRYLEAIIADHKSTSILHDLRTASKIGQGEWWIDQRDGIPIAARLKLKLAELFLDRRRFFRQAVKDVGWLASAYLFVWKVVVLAGYLAQWQRRKIGEKTA